MKLRFMKTSESHTTYRGGVATVEIFDVEQIVEMLAEHSHRDTPDNELFRHPSIIVRHNPAFMTFNAPTQDLPYAIEVYDTWRE